MYQKQMVSLIIIWPARFIIPYRYAIDNSTVHSFMNKIPSNILQIIFSFFLSKTHILYRKTQILMLIFEVLWLLGDSGGGRGHSQLYHCWSQIPAQGRPWPWLWWPWPWPWQWPWPWPWPLGRATNSLRLYGNIQLKSLLYWICVWCLIILDY